MALQNSTLSTTSPSTILTAYGLSAAANISASLVLVAPGASDAYFGRYSANTEYESSPLGSLTWTFQDTMSFEPTSRFDYPQNYLLEFIELWLAPNGCSTDGTALRLNCSEACVRKELIFNDTSTLANCMVLPFMSQLLDTRILPENSTEIAESFGIVADNGLANEVTSILRNCFKARCQLSKSCKANNETDYEYYNYSMAAMHNDFVYEDGYDLCDYVDLTVLGDIAGIGIYISYWLQSGITLVAWTLLRFYDSWIYYVAFVTLVWPRGSAQARNAAKAIHIKAKQHALPRLAAALVEFQKAQCYFMIAVQIAAMVTISGHRLQSTNLQQLYNNWEAVRYISVSGFLPVTFNLLSLHSVGKKSSYLILLSTVTVAVSAATLFRTGAFSASDKDIVELQNQSQTSSLSECGYHDPTIYCLDTFFDNGNWVLNLNDTFAYSLTILILIYLDMLKSRIATCYQRCKTWLHRFRAFETAMSLVTKVVSALSRLHEWMYRQSKASKLSWNPHAPHGILLVRKFLADCVLKMLKNWQNTGLGFLWLVVWSWYLFCFFSAFVTLSVLLTRGMINFSWTFGQIVGITVWLEPCVEYAYLESQGMKAANYRFLSPWRLTRPDENTSADDQTTSEPAQYDLKTINNGYSIPERSPSITLSSYSVVRDEELGEGQHHADTMAQRLL